MKIKMQGSELKKVDIDFLSLVKRGANRAPFKVIKAEDGGVHAKTGLIAGVQKFFQMTEPAPSVVAIFVEKSALEKACPNLAVAGFDLSNHEIQDDVVVFKQAGFDDCKSVIMLKSEARVGMAIANVEKHADTFCGKLTFDPSVAQTGFYPGVNAAMAALQAMVNVSKADTAASVGAFTTYVSQITKAIPQSVWEFESLQRGFGSATSINTDGGSVDTTNIAKAASELAAQLLKAAGGMDAGVTTEASGQTGSSSSESDGNSGSSELAGSEDDSEDTEAARKAKVGKGANDTVSSETVGEDAEKKRQGTDSSEDDSMSKAEQKPIVFKDEAGKEYVQAYVIKTGEVKKYTPGAKIPAGEAYMTMPWEQDPALGGTNNGNGQGQGKAKASESADYEVSHTGAGGDKGNMDGSTPAGSMKKADLEAAVAALATLPDLVTALAKSVEAQGELLKKTNDRLGAVEKTAETAVRKADSTVVHISPNYDSAYESLGGGSRRVQKSARTPEQIRKAEYPDDLWAGSLGVLETHIPGVEEA